MKEYMLRRCDHCTAHSITVTVRNNILVVQSRKRAVYLYSEKYPIAANKARLFGSQTESRVGNKSGRNVDAYRVNDSRSCYWAIGSPAVPKTGRKMLLQRHLI
jgi:hypothetical protein